MANFCVGKWVILVDADEFLIYPDCEERPVAELVSEMEMQGFDAICADMVDMYPLGDLEAADFSRNPPFTVAPWHDAVPLVPWHLGSGHFSNSPSFVSALRHRLLPDFRASCFRWAKVCVSSNTPLGSDYPKACTMLPTSIPIPILCGSHTLSTMRVSSERCKPKSGVASTFRMQRYTVSDVSLLTENGGRFSSPDISAKFRCSADFALIPKVRRRQVTRHRHPAAH